MLNQEWADKNVIAQELGLGPRRVLVLAKELGWRAKPGTKTPGMKAALRLFSGADVRAYQARGNPAIDEHGNVVPHTAVPARRPPDTSGLVSVLERLIEALIKPAQMAALPAPEVLAPHRYVSLRQAAKHVGLSRAVLDRACDSGQLSYVIDGPVRRQRKMVRLRDVEEIDFGFQMRQEARASQGG